MQPAARYKIVALSIRTNVREVHPVLEELNAGEREQTFPKTLTRCFRTIEHDARVVGLSALAEFAQAVKEASADVLTDPTLYERLAKAADVLRQAADEIEAGRAPAPPPTFKSLR